MSPALPVVSGQETVTALEKIGFTQVGQKGSHVKLRDQGGRTVIVPIHRELARGTLSAIIRQSGITVSEFIDLL
ncbi:MAG: type II toxin-antitoxin system HicA family toxin [Acidimicrobiales bacterium]